MNLKDSLLRNISVKTKM